LGLGLYVSPRMNYTLGKKSHWLQPETLWIQNLRTETFGKCFLGPSMRNSTISEQFYAQAPRSNDLVPSPNPNPSGSLRDEPYILATCLLSRYNLSVFSLINLLFMLWSSSDFGFPYLLLVKSVWFFMVLYMIPFLSSRLYILCYFWGRLPPVVYKIPLRIYFLCTLGARTASVLMLDGSSKDWEKALQ
jgi:hypothetical protein